MSNTSTHADFLDRIIFDDGLKIVDAKIVFGKEPHIALLLNTDDWIDGSLAGYVRLEGVQKEKLRDFKIIGGGTIIEWDELDEHLSLKGFIRDQMIRQCLPNYNNQQKRKK